MKTVFKKVGTVLLIIFTSIIIVTKITSSFAYIWIGIGVGIVFIIPEVAEIIKIMKAKENKKKRDGGI